VPVEIMNLPSAGFVIASRPLRSLASASTYARELPELAAGQRIGGQITPPTTNAIATER
jgi:hypothetical protein